MDEDGVDIESDEETDKIINEIEAQRVGGNGGGGGLKEAKKDEVIIVLKNDELTKNILGFE